MSEENEKDPVVVVRRHKVTGGVIIRSEPRIAVLQIEGRDELMVLVCPVMEEGDDSETYTRIKEGIVRELELGSGGE